MSVTPFDALTITFEVSWTTAWNATPSYTDESAYVRSWSVRRGRSSQFDQFNAGTLRIELENSSRRFDPTYTAGPLFGNLLPRRKCRLSATYNAVTYRLFTGYLDGFGQEGEPSNTLGTATLTAADGFKILARSRVPTGGASVGDGDTLSERVGRMLDYADWPVGERDIDPNSPTSVHTLESGQIILSNLYEVCNGDLGQFFIAGDGDATYHGRAWQLANNLTAAYTIGDLISAGEIPYTNVTFDGAPDTQIFNRALANYFTGDTTVGFTPAQLDIEDATSKAAFGESAMDLGTIGVNNANVVQNLLEYIIAYYKNPKLRVVRVGFNPRPHSSAHPSATSVYPPVLSAEVGTRWTFKRRPQNVGSAISQDVIVEGISYTMTPDSFSATFDLSQAPSAPDGGTYWRMGFGKWTTGSPAATWA